MAWITSELILVIVNELEYPSAPTPPPLSMNSLVLLADASLVNTAETSTDVKSIINGYSPSVHVYQPKHCIGCTHSQLFSCVEEKLVLLVWGHCVFQLTVGGVSVNSMRGGVEIYSSVCRNVALKYAHPQNSTIELHRAKKLNIVDAYLPSRSYEQVPVARCSYSACVENSRHVCIAIKYHDAACSRRIDAHEFVDVEFVCVE